MSIKIAKASPFEGSPRINMPKIYGIVTGKEMMYRIPVTGKRPIDITVTGLADGLILENGIIRGKTKADSEFTVTVTAKNSLGSDTVSVLFKSKDSLLLTPLMGFTTWNAFGENVSQESVERTASLIDNLGIAEYGYNYINVDSGWQGEYGGKYNAIMPNKKFPDMKGMCDKLHSLGMNCGIYSTPMTMAWGCPPFLESIPGCTTGETDLRYSETVIPGAFPIGRVRHEEDCVKQWDEWGFDYLKYDWVPTDTENADMMYKALCKSERAFAYCVTTRANVKDAEYWVRTCNSWRDAADSFPIWRRICEFMETVDTWAPYVTEGHFYDLDMLEIGMVVWCNRYLTDHEVLFAYTLRAFFMSPIQLSCHIDDLTDFEFDVICNDEIIAIHQDSLCSYPKLILEKGSAKLYERKLENGDRAIAVFNLGVDYEDITLDFAEGTKIRDVWTKEDIGEKTSFRFHVKSHCVRVFRISEA